MGFFFQYAPTSLATLSLIESTGYALCKKMLPIFQFVAKMALGQLRSAASQVPFLDDANGFTAFIKQQLPAFDPANSMPAISTIFPGLKK